ncbi:class II histone deacetylase [Pseudomonas taiwanensis]|uniref:class II histone deacetylase n=1 Tax=Pseudomonas taiwanensis TaxID=470150 RepID=UPI0015BA1CE8|nr:class II histone deacetylase [Pseudomonas taiwanensis]NWL78701.1 class II histone deacetylase [Pseudomonas taiwanensis]
MTRRSGFFFDERCFWHAAGLHSLVLPVGGWLQPPSGSGHAESPETKRRLKSLMDVSGLSDRLVLSSAPMAAEDDLLRVHPAQYLERFKAMSDAGHGELGEEAAVGSGTYEIARQSAGLAIAAVDAVLRGELDNAYALSRPPGHHCLADRGMGFCYLANIAIAVETAKARHGVGRVAVLDWDVHHGNGTQSIFYGRDDVLTLSIHQDNCFPVGQGAAEERGTGAGLGYNLNLPLFPGSGDDAYRYAMERVIVPALERFEPELIVVACGFDANGVDPLARMLLHSESFRAMTAILREAADRLCGGRLVLVHEGGYAEAYVPFCGHAVIEELAGVRTAVEDPFLPMLEGQQPNAEFRTFQRQAIDRMAAALLN